MNLVQAFAATLLLLRPSDAFIHSIVKPHSTTLSVMKMAKEGKSDQLQGVFRAFGVAAMVLTFDVADAPAATIVQNHAMYSSSVQVSKTITTMEFSLPSSYDSISEAKASGVNELTQVENTVTNSVRKKAPKQIPSESSSKSGFGGISMPSIGNDMSPEEKAAIAKDKAAEREAAATEKAAIAKEKAAEKEAIAAEKAAEKNLNSAASAATRDAEKVAKQADAKQAAIKAAAKKEARASDSKFAGAEFVDMGLPSYEPAATGTKKSAFAF